MDRWRRCMEEQFRISKWLTASAHCAYRVWSASFYLHFTKLLQQASKENSNINKMRKHIHSPPDWPRRCIVLHKLIWMLDFLHSIALWRLYERNAEIQINFARRNLFSRHNSQAQRFISHCTKMVEVIKNENEINCGDEGYRHGKMCTFYLGIFYIIGRLSQCTCEWTHRMRKFYVHHKHTHTHI